MLVLTRRKGQAVHINKNVKVVVVDVQHGRVKLGIEAPRDVPVMREELVKGEESEAEDPGEDQTN